MPSSPTPLPHQLSSSSLLAILAGIFTLLASSGLIDSSLNCCLVGLVFIFLAIARGIHRVDPSQRAVFIDRVTGVPTTLESGLHLILNPRYYRQRVSVSNWRKFKQFPAVGSRLHVDPPATQVHTCDGIAATADVSLECVVREWSSATTVKDAGCIHSRVCTTVNQWLSEQLGQVAADQCTYGYLNQLLNTPEAMDSLNAKLASGFTYLSAHTIVVDAHGIQLSPTWLKNREDINHKRQLLAERETVLQRELEIARLERTKLQEAAEYELAAQQRRVEQEVRSNKLVAEAQVEAAAARARSELVALKEKSEHEEAREARQLRQALDNGLTSEQYAALAMARVHFETMAATEGVKYLAVPPHLLGLGGLPAREVVALP